MKKSTLILFTALLLSLCFSGCKKSSSTSGGNEATEVLNTSVTVTSDLAGTQSGDITITYILKGPESDIGDLDITFSLDQGKTFKETTPGSGGDGTRKLASSLEGKQYTYIWDSVKDLGNTRKNDVKINIRLRVGNKTQMSRNYSCNIDNIPTKVVATVPVGTQPWGIEVTPDGSRVYVANREENSVSVIRTSDLTVEGTAWIDGGPLDIAFSPDGAYAYVVCVADSVAVIRTSDLAYMDSVTKAGNTPNAIAIAPDGKNIYVTSRHDDPPIVTVIDTADNTITGTIALYDNEKVPYRELEGIAVTPDGKWLYVTDKSSNHIGVINAESNTLTMSLNLGSEMWHIIVTPDGRFAYASDAWGDVHVIDTSDNTEVATVALEHTRGLASTPDSRLIYVAGNQDSTVYVIQTSDHTVIASIPVGAEPLGVAVSPDGKNVFVTNSKDNTVSVIGF